MQLPSRRGSLQEIPFDKMANASLWLDKFIKGQNYGELKKDEEMFKQTLIEDSIKISVPEIYKNAENGFFHRWKEALKDVGAKFKTLKLDGRMIVGLGGESVLETSITLHKIYGVPFIPGSAIKGLAASYAHKHLGEQWHKETTKTKLGDFQKLVFGSQDFAGIVVFHDALLIPETDKLPLHQEIMTVHHSDYYGGNDKPPADWDSPMPVPFLSASGSYLLALSTESGLENVIEKTFEILELALHEEGIGAKTSSGYGRGNFEPSEEEIAAEKDDQDVERFIGRVNAIRNNDVASQINNYFQEWKQSKLSYTSKKKMAQAIIDKVREAGREKASKEKGWYQELVEFVCQNN